MPLRVLIWNVPRLLGDIIKDILRADPDLVIVEFDGTSKALSQAISDEAPDVIVTGVVDDRLEPACSEFVLTQTRRKVVGVRDDGRSAFLYRLRPEYVSFGELSAERLVQAIRAPGSWH